MGMFDLGTDVKQEVEKDTLGGGGVRESGVYDFIIKQAYLTESTGEAIAVNLSMEDVDGGKFKQQIYISSGKAKGKKFTYTDKRTGDERPLPGYSQVNSICSLATDLDFGSIDPEDKVVMVYDFDQKKEVPTQVPVIMELINAPITLGILKIVESKRKLVGSDYVATNETREINEISKIFKTDGRLTGAEIAAGMSTGEFVDKWEEKNKGKVVDKVDKNVKAQTGIPTAQASAAIPSTTPNLFGNA